MASLLRKQTTRYSDFKINLLVHPDKQDLSLNNNEEAVKRSIKNLLFTGKTERFFQPNIGAGLQKYLFENISRVTASLIKKDIENTINTYESRANLLNVEVWTIPDQNAYATRITFSIINNLTPIELNVILERVR